MTKHEIIHETVEFYSEDVSRRATNEFGDCRYYLESDVPKSCAVGRCLQNPEGFNENAAVEHYNFDAFESNFKPQYQGHEWEFWKDLQKLHDGRHNWNTLTGVGLSERGLLAVDRLLKKYE